MSDRQIPARLKYSYAIGAIAYGIKERSFNSFLMIYYNQVLGLSPVLTGLAILVALFFDGFTDPAIGHYSDNWRSRWGRRHPFMYFAIIPTCLAFFALWNPPFSGENQWQLFTFLTISAVLTRGFLGMFEIPNTSLLAEITTDYDERTKLSSLRHAVGWVSDIMIAAVTFVVFLTPTPEQPIGILNKQGYLSYAIFATIIMFIAMVISTTGTHACFARPSFDLATKKQSLLAILKIIFSNASFRAIFIATIFAMVAFGISIALQIYFATFMFGLTHLQLAAFGPVAVAGALVSMWLTPRFARAHEKRRVAMTMVALSLLFGNFAIMLRVFGWFPENDTPMLLPLILITTFFSTIFVVGKHIMLVSMTADLVEDVQTQSGQSNPGMFFAAMTFSKKTVTGLGIMASALILSTSPKQNPDFIAEFSSSTGIPLVYVIVISLVHLGTLVFLSRYTLTRAQHEKNLLQK